MRSRHRTVALLVCLPLAACGGGGGDASTSGGTVASPAATVATTSTTSTTATTPSTAGRARSTRLPRPCSLLPLKAVSQAIGKPVRPGLKMAPGCTYNDATQFVTVSVQAATGDNAAAMASAFAHPQPGDERFVAAGARGLVRQTIKAGLGNGSQSRVTFIRGRVIVQIVQTDSRPSRKRSFAGSVTRLGRTAAARL